MKKIYRIELFQSDTLINDLVILAAISNGGRYISLDDIEAIARTNGKRFPTISKDVSINRINDHLLTIDKGTESLLVLTEIEVMDIEQTQISPAEAKNILTELKQGDSQNN